MNLFKRKSRANRSKRRSRSSSGANAKNRVHSRTLRCEPLEDRVLLYFHGSVVGGLGCEAMGEAGRIDFPLLADVIDAKPHLPGAKAPSVFRAAVRAALGNSIGDTIDKVDFHWDAELLNTWGPIEFSKIPGVVESKGQTFGHDVYLAQPKPDLVYDKTTAKLLVHELAHVRQYERFSESLSNFGYH